MSNHEHMKPFEYYSAIESPHHSYADIKAKLRREIGDKPMTEAERVAAIKSLDESAEAMDAVVNAEYHAETARKRVEFFQDARADLGYDEWLDEEGVRVLELEAWDRGIARGEYGEVYTHLEDLSSFVKALVPHVIASRAWFDMMQRD